MRALFTILLPVFISAMAYGQIASDYAVRLTATTQVSPPRITLKWRAITVGTPTYYVLRKSFSATSWGSPVATITTGDTTYVDNSVIVDSAYEYYVSVGGTGLPQSPSGFIYAGIKAPAIHNRGTLVMLVDTAFTDSCAAELSTLMKDINGDGWQLVRHDFPRTTPDTVVRAAIKTDYANIPDVKAVLIVGHIAVPYAGELNPDAHPDHLGAWPCDAFYGSMTGVWTDMAVNNVTSANTANHNVPGDGKWDDVSIPSGVQLQVSRIDMWNMPAFTATEQQMMRRYLRRAHIYKMDSLNMRKRGIINDNFGAFSGEAFAANAWRNFTPAVGYDSIYELPYIASLADSAFQWAYGCGGGTYTSAGGIGNTANFAAAGAVHTIFSMMFGSYFGDWNYANSFLRAQLCVDTPALTCCWAGRPNWFMHHMALGHNIGHSVRLTQNNAAPMVLYQPTNHGAGWGHIALMGDLSLRTDYIKPPSNVNVATTLNHGATISWLASPDAAVTSYYVYRADSAWGHYERISPLVTGLTFTDTVGVNGLKYYMVRPVKLQSTPSGGYHNLGIGITDTASVTYPLPVSAGGVMHVAPGIALFPNPTGGTLGITVDAAAGAVADMYVMNMAGARFYPARRQLRAGQNAYSLDVSALPAGAYLLCVQVGGQAATAKFVKQ